MRLSTHEWTVAKEVCTPRQIQVLDAYRRGWGAKRISKLLDIDESTAQEHIRRGLRRLGKALENLAA